MKKVLHTPLGYMVNALLSHYPEGHESRNITGATVINVVRRYGKQNEGTLQVNNLVEVKLENGERKSFDASYVTKVYKPKNFVHIRHVKKKYYEVKSSLNSGSHSIYKFHCVSRINKKLVGTPSLLIQLVHDKSKFRNDSFSFKKACDAFVTHFNIYRHPSDMKYTFRIKEKVLIRWFEQNFNRFQDTAKYLNAEATKELMADEQEYWNECGFENAAEAFEDLRKQIDVAIVSRPPTTDTVQ